MDLYIHSPIRLHGVVLNYLSTGTTLPTLPIRNSRITMQFLHYDMFRPQFLAIIMLAENDCKMAKNSSRNTW
jgi:hypothetical protein